MDATEEDPFVIEVVGLDMNGDDGTIIDWTSQPVQRWKIAEATAIVGFDSALFSIDTSRFAPFHRSPRIASIWLEQDGNAIYLNAITVPEPATRALVAIAAAAWLLLCCWRPSS